MGESTTTSNLLKAIIVLVIIVIAVVALWIIVPKLYELFKPEELSLEMQHSYEDNFNAIVMNIEKCKTMSETDCICEIFPNFPGTFKGILNIESEGRATTLSFETGKKTYFTEKIEDLYVAITLVEPDGLYPGKGDAIDLYSKKWINFERSPPILDREGLGKGAFGIGTAEPKIMSASVFKDKNGFLRLLVSDYSQDAILHQMNQLVKCTK